MYSAILNDLHAEKECAPYSHDSWWKTQESKAFFQGMQSNDQFENARLHIDFFTMNHDGTEYKGRNSRFMPGKSIRAKFCRDVFQLLTIPAFRENMLVQEYSKENVVCFDTHHPLSIGWTEIDGYYSYSGIANSSSSAAKYGNQFMRANIQENLQDVLDLFTLIPSETSVPLVAYTVFSILKYFVKSYPSRISPKEPFTTVIRKQGRAMFVSLKGNKAWDIAGAFCGGFTDYGSDNNLSLKKTIVSRPNEEKHTKQLHGTTRALLANMVEGVSAGFTKELELVGIGFRATLKGKTLTLKIGYSHLVNFEIEEGLTVECPNETSIKISGIDKQRVGEFAANVRAVRKPEPYKGKGIRYKGENVRRKEGKTAGKK